MSRRDIFVVVVVPRERRAHEEATTNTMSRRDNFLLIGRLPNPGTVSEGALPTFCHKRKLKSKS